MIKIHLSVVTYEKLSRERSKGKGQGKGRAHGAINYQHDLLIELLRSISPMVLLGGRRSARSTMSGLGRKCSMILTRLGRIGRIASHSAMAKRSQQDRKVRKAITLIDAFQSK